MNTTDMLKSVSEKSGKSIAETKNLYQSMTDLLQAYFSNGSGVAIPNLGTFTVKKKQKRKGYNPDSGQHMEIPEKLVLTFTPSTRLKEIVR